ncbi:protein-disulfide reductase DsbD [Roseivivax isoporae]|nr:protein-disulfide reductase DsbD [Roseivivax isoporae]
MPRFPRAALAALLMLSAGAAAAQPAPDPLPAEKAFALTVRDDASGLSLTWEIAEGYYLYRDHLRAEGPDGAPVAVETPPGTRKDDPTFGETEIYRDRLQARIAPAAGPVTLTWQGCLEDSICYPPQTRVIGAAAEDTGRAPDVAPARDRDIVLAADPGLLDGLSARGGAGLVVAGFLGFGLLLAFTPCVFPMVPIVAGMVTGRGAEVGARRGLALSGAYVIAMASAFALLGVVAAWSGRNLQAVLQSPPAIGVAAALFVLLALSMFGLFELQVPRALSSRLSRVQGRQGSLGGAALLGATSALIVGPCVTAPLAGALLYIAQTGDVMLGALALFALGLGQGLPLLAVGAFGPRILPRSGPWMEGARRVFGMVFLGFAIWLAGRVLPGTVTLALWSALLIGAGALLATGPRGSRAGRPGRALGAILLLAGALQGAGAAVGGDDPLRPLAPFAGDARRAPDEASAFTTVRSAPALEAVLAGESRPALVYVTAGWCTTCRAIERGPLADPAVQDALGRLAPVKVDVTEAGAASREVLDLLGAAGPPTMVFLDADRAEAPGSRIVGDTDSAAMLASIAEATR